jgi:hypothetical protein
VRARLTRAFKGLVERVVEEVVLQNRGMEPAHFR